MKVLSLFDGMSCGMLAFMSAGITVDRYVAFEIDKYAVQTSAHNFPMIEHRGDVFRADFTEFQGFDFVVGGSPCTYWSIAQKNNRETEASGMGWELFSQYVRAVKEAQPLYFIYENNKSMSNAIRESITETFGFEPICINSALVSAQNRQRLYWVGKRNFDGTYSRVHVEQPEDRGIILRDVLDGAEPFGESDGKAFCMTASYQFGVSPHDTLGKSRRSMVAEPVNVTETGKAQCLKSQYGKSAVANFMNGSSHYPASGVAEPVGTTKDGKAFCMTSGYANGSGEKIGNYAAHTLQKGCKSMAAEPVRIGTLPNNAKNKAHDSQQYRIYSTNGKSVALCGNGGGLGAITGLYAIPCEWGESGEPLRAVSYADGKTYIVYQVKDWQITIKGEQYPIKLADGFYIIRKLTVSECKRLQTVPEWYAFPVSDTQAYKMLGNGWTVEVIAHLIAATQADILADEQLDLFKIYGVCT